MTSYLPQEINDRKTDSIRAMGPVDIRPVRQDILDLPPDQWDKPEDFEANYNKRGAIRSVRHIVFKFSDRREAPYRYFELPMWREWKDRLLPLLTAAARPLGYECGIYPRVMLAKLPPQTFVAPHVDGELRGIVPHKIHVPIQTNPKAYFFLGNERFHFEEGCAWEVNNGMRHAVANYGDTDRIHLIFEYLDGGMQPFTA